MRVLLIRLALWWLSREMKRDWSYAWAWHCNLAVPMQDEGVSHKRSNLCAAMMMEMLFKVDTYKEIERQFKYFRR
jgi:hypothetical protein